jgi:hypothetical protein
VYDVERDSERHGKYSAQVSGRSQASPMYLVNQEVPS